jgi:phage major head subunit gpT-like protein
VVCFAARETALSSSTHWAGDFPKSEKFTGNRFNSIKEVKTHKKSIAGKLYGTDTRPETIPRK